MGRGRRLFMISMIVLAAVLAISGAIFGDRQFIYNSTNSVEIGWYIRTSKVPAIGDIVDFPIPAPIHEYVRSRMGHLDEWYILKPIVAVEGDFVSTLDGKVAVNGHILADIPLTDSLGNPAPVWTGERRLEEGELFVLSTRIEHSLDSRTYGPIKQTDITGVYRKLW